jgi:hypothetical protein
MQVEQPVLQLAVLRKSFGGAEGVEPLTSALRTADSVFYSYQQYEWNLSNISKLQPGTRRLSVADSFLGRLGGAGFMHHLRLFPPLRLPPRKILTLIPQNHLRAIFLQLHLLFKLKLT